VDQRKDRYIYGNSVEALFVQALGERMTNRCRNTLREAGLDLSKDLRPMYPVEDYERFVRIAREELFPYDPDAAAYEQMGRLFMQGYFKTLIGRALKGVIRLLGPHQLIKRLPESFSSGSTFIKAEVRQLGPTEHELRVTGVGHYPTFTRGSMLEAIGLSGVKNLRVEITTIGADDTTVYAIRWDP
jgi:uncharacterized protein (TIGR02265 family)